MAVYLWNLIISESLYPSLQCLEVALRNAVDREMTVLLKNSYWFEDAYLLENFDQERVVKAKTDLRTKGKTVVPQQVISELTFGFWVSLFTTPYEMKLVRPIIKRVFPNAPKHLRSPDEVSRRLQRARDLRNRVFHHEPIWHWPDLKDRHAEIVDTLEWINETKSRTLKIVDNFDRVYATGWKDIVDELDFLVAEREIGDLFARPLGIK